MIIKIIKFLFSMLVIIIVIFSLYSLFSRFILKKDIVNIFGYSYLRVRSNSMLPDIKVNDIIIIRLTKECKEGDIITFKEDEIYITHRVMRIVGEKIITQGDANDVEDDPITRDDVIGVIVKII